MATLTAQCCTCKEGAVAGKPGGSAVHTFLFSRAEPAKLDSIFGCCHSTTLAHTHVGILLRVSPPPVEKKNKKEERERYRGAFGKSTGCKICRVRAQARASVSVTWCVFDGIQRASRLLRLAFLGCVHRQTDSSTGATVA